MFQLTEDQKAIQALAREFTKNVIKPVAAKYDEEETFPMDIVKQAREYGLN